MPNRPTSNKLNSANVMARRESKSRRDAIKERMKTAVGNKARMTILTIGYQFWVA